MKVICFIGKGSSGKTTMTRGMVGHLGISMPRAPMLVLDASGKLDLSARLCEAFGCEVPPLLSTYGEQLIRYLHNKRTDLSLAEMLSSTPPSRESRFIFPRSQDPVMGRVSVGIKSTMIVRVGAYGQKDVGVACLHGQLGVAELLLGHLLDWGEELTVLVDTVTGTDIFGAPLAAFVDLFVCVVDPTHKSLSVYDDAKKLMEPLGVPHVVIVNDGYDGDDTIFIQEQIPNAPILGFVPHDPLLKRSDASVMQRFITTNQQSFAKLAETINTTKSDWHARWERVNEAHRITLEKWYPGTPTGIDPLLTYELAQSLARTRVIL